MSNLSQQLRVALANVDAAYQDSRQEQVDETESEDEDEKAPLTLKRSLHSILNTVEEVKENLTDQQYLRMTKKLKTAYDLVPDTTECHVSVESFYALSRYPNGLDVCSKKMTYRMHLNDKEILTITDYLHAHGTMTLPNGVSGTFRLQNRHFRGTTLEHLCEISKNTNSNVTVRVEDEDEGAYANVVLPYPRMLTLIKL